MAAGVPASTSPGARRPSSSVPRETRPPSRNSKTPPTAAEHRAGRRQVPYPDVAQEGRTGHAAGNQHDVIGRRAERAQLAHALEPMPPVGLRVHRHEGIAGRRAVVETPDGDTVPPRPAVDRRVELRAAREVHHARTRAAGLHQANAHAPRGQARDEHRRAVDRVDHEAALPARRPLRPLLRHDSDVGPAFPELRGDEGLDRAIRLRDQGAIRLALRRHPVEMLQRDSAGAGGDRLQRGARDHRRSRGGPVGRPGAHRCPRSRARWVKRSSS